MKKTSRDAYYREAESWSHDRQDGLRASRRIAWIIAGIAAVTALFEALALMLLTPLKSVEPYTLLVDRQTGYVQALKPLDANRVAPDAALNQSFLVQYVIARESFDINALQTNYRKVALWSTDSARSSYIARTQASNPDSPLVRYPRSTIVETRVKSVSAMGFNTAFVRFETRRTDAGGRIGPAMAWVAIIRYRYSNAPMRLEDRYINPLGFQVLRYRRDAEALAPEQGPVPAVQSSLPSSAAMPAPPAIYPAVPTTTIQPAYPRSR